MGRAAKLTSIDAVEVMTAALARFTEDASAALSDLELELRRALQWIQHDRKTYWAQEVRQGWDRVAKARQELERCRVLHKVADHQPGCREEKKALEQAKRRLGIAQEKVEAVRRWSHAVEKEVTEYRGSVNQLAHWLQSDSPRAVAALHRMSGALERYVRLQSTAETLTADGSGQRAAGSQQPPALPGEIGQALPGEIGQQPPALPGESCGQPPPDAAEEQAAEES